MKKKPEKKDFLTRWNRLKGDRSSFDEQWKELSSLILPRHGEFSATNRDNKSGAFNKIYDSTATRALDVLGAGMQSGVTSPSREWFRLAAPDSGLNDDHQVKEWLSTVETILQAIFAKSNTYRALHSIYKELGCFGTGASVIIPDHQNVIHHYPLTAGEYCLATDARGRVNTLYREFRLTVAEMVEEFGFGNCSAGVQRMFESGNNHDELMTILHVIEPRSARDVTKSDNLNMAWGSYYMEMDANEGKLLRESGFPFFPVVAPRWSVSSGSVYGTNCPAMTALGDIKQLQVQQLRKAQVIDYQSNPPLQVPGSLRDTRINTLPGGVTYYDQAHPEHGIKSLFDVRLDAQLLLQSIQETQRRIEATFYADIFLMFDGLDRNRMTATEVAERQQEKMLMLGPVFERLINELLDPIIEITFAYAAMAGIIPPPPPVMQNVGMDVEYVSIFAQAQKAVGINAVGQFLGNVGNMAQFKPEALDIINADEAVRITADMIGVDPKILYPPEYVDQIRQQRAQQQAEQQEMASAQQQANTMKTLSDVDMSGDSAVSAIFDQGMAGL